MITKDDNPRPTHHTSGELAAAACAFVGLCPWRDVGWGCGFVVRFDCQFQINFNCQVNFNCYFNCYFNCQINRSKTFNRMSPCGTDVYSPVPGAPDFLCVAKERSAKKGDP